VSLVTQDQHKDLDAIQRSLDLPRGMHLMQLDHLTARDVPAPEPLPGIRSGRVGSARTGRNDGAQARRPRGGAPRNPAGGGDGRRGGNRRGGRRGGGGGGRRTQAHV
jgi:hypothetical protein